MFFFKGYVFNDDTYDNNTWQPKTAALAFETD